MNHPDYSPRSITQFFECDEDCNVCLGTGHVCDEHPGLAWGAILADDDDRGCRCGAPGMPCPNGGPLRPTERTT